MSRPPSVSVQIYNQVYHLACDQTGPQSIERAAAYLDRKMHETAAAAGERPTLDIAILAAMGVAESLLKEQRRKAELLEKADRRLQYFARRLEDEDHPAPPPTARF